MLVGHYPEWDRWSGEGPPKGGMGAVPMNR
jgi:hypothetical protein